MAQKVLLTDDNKLVIKTDNGEINADNETSTEVKGTFEIEAEDVVALAALLNDATYRATGFKNYLYGIYLKTFIYISKDDAIKECKKINDDLLDKNNKLLCEIERLKSLISNHNNKCLFERNKIKIEE